MSFGFGASSSFGAAAKPTGFGAPIMSSASTTPAFGLGTNTSTGFGGFGTTPTNTAFGTQPAATGFGTTTNTGFGTAPASTGFGGFGSFGTTATTTTATGFGGFGGFGATTSSAPSTGFFGATTTSTPSTGFSFGGGGNAFSFGGTTSAAPATGFSFGSTGTTSTASNSFGGFGSFGATNTGGGLFGGAQTSTTGGFGGFGNTFGKPATGFSLGGSTFGATQQPQQPQPIDPSVAFHDSILNCQVFGDERDNTLRRWNLLQALFGFGKGYYSQQAPPVEYDTKNPFCRFKAIAYSVRPSAENKDGCVALVFNKKEAELRPLEQQIVTNLAQILGNKPNLVPSVESIRAMSDTKTIAIVSVLEKAANGTSRKVPAQELSSYLQQPMPKQQLTGLQVENVFPQVELTAEQLREYLDTPPPGIDAQTWQQAQEDNPFPDRLIPVPVIGFSEVRWRLKCQETEAALQQAVLDKMSEEMAQLQRKHTSTVANIVDYKSRLVELQHRILKVVILQEKSRKMGMTLLPHEETLNSRLEALSATLNSSAFKNRLAALTEGVKSLTDSNKEPQRYKMDPSVVADIKQFLNMSQSGMSHMIETIQTDLSELKVIKDGMGRLLQRPV